MPNATVRIDPKTQEILRHLAEKTGKTMQSILAEALEQYRRQSFLDETRQAFAALRSDERQWADELAERAAWDGATNDGSDD